MIRKPVLLTLLMCTLAALACNLAVEPEPASTVEIRVPVNNTTFAVGVDVLVQVYAADRVSSVGRVDLEIDDQPAGTSTVPDAAGQAIYIASFAWTAQGVGVHSMRAIAFNVEGAFVGEDELLVNVVEASFVPVQSGPAQPGGQQPDAAKTEEVAPPQGTGITAIPPIEVTQAPAQPQILPSATPTTPPPPPPTATPTQPSAPTSGPAAGTSSIGLNVRSGPGTNYPVVSSLLAGQQIELVGRNVNGTWLVIPLSSGQGWVSAQFIETTANTAILPVIQPPPPPPTATFTTVPTITPIPATPTPTIPPVLPDLGIDGVTIDPPFPPRVGVTMTIQVTVRNSGNASTGDGFLVQLDFAYGQNIESNQIPFPPLEPGASFTGTGFITMPAGSEGQPGNGNIRTDVDNRILESAENNNLHATAGYTVAAP